MSGAPPRRAGTVVWVDLSTSDVEGAIHFYERLLGWHFEDSDSAMGPYVVARVAAGEVGGMMAQTPDETAAGIPPAWTVVVGADHLPAVRCRCGRPASTLREKPLTDDDIQRLADVAQTGYEPSRLRPLGGRRRMGSAPTVVVPVRLDAEVRAAVEARATGEHTSTSEIIREAHSRSFTSPDPGRKRTDGTERGRETPVTCGHSRHRQSPKKSALTRGASP